MHTSYPDANCALRHADPLQLLVATILSAQSTDATVNRVTPELFRRFPTAEAIAAAPLADLEELVHATGFFRQKAKNIRGACEMIAREHGGAVPSSMDELVKLPGVARKTANVVLGTAFGRNDGIVVDTHVGRIAVRLGLTPAVGDGKDAVRIEQGLMTLIPRDEWTYLSHAMIHHGRQVCTARKPRCGECSLAPHCPSAMEGGGGSVSVAGIADPTPASRAAGSPRRRKSVTGRSVDKVGGHG